MRLSGNIYSLIRIYTYLGYDNGVTFKRPIISLNYLKGYFNEYGYGYLIDNKYLP